MSGQRRTDLDARAYELRQLAYRAIAKWLRVTFAMARRRALRHERTLRESGESGDRSQRSRQLFQTRRGHRWSVFAVG